MQLNGAVWAARRWKRSRRSGCQKWDSDVAESAAWLLAGLRNYRKDAHFLSAVRNVGPLWPPSVGVGQSHNSLKLRRPVEKVRRARRRRKVRFWQKCDKAQCCLRWNCSVKLWVSYREHRLLHRHFRLFLLVRAGFVPLKVNSFFSFLAVTLQGSCVFFLP